MHPVLETLLVGLLFSVPLVILVILLVRRLRTTTAEKSDIEGEEKRMFGFLHLLGQAIEDAYSSRKLFRVIVDGIEEVLGAEGAALYLVSADGMFLVPAHLSPRCPPLHELTAEQWDEIGDDPERLSSFLRLAKIPTDGGVLWRCLREGTVQRISQLPRRGDGGDECREAILTPVAHGGRTLGVVGVVANARRPRFTANDFDVFQSIAEQSAFALGNAMIQQEAFEKRRLERELRMASEVQRVLLPAAEPESPGYRICGTNVPARIVSGDYYDYIELPAGRLGVAIADVSGKGVPAGLMMATCRSALRALATECDSPAAALGAVNRQLFPDIREDMFISMAYVIVEHDSGRIRLARAGHEAPLLYRRSTGEVEALKPGGLALGIDEGEVFERVTHDLEATVEKGDCLLLYTDGVNEAENEEGDEFGRERLQAIFRDSAGQGAEAAVQSLQRELEQFVGERPQADDITLIAIERR